MTARNPFWCGRIAIAVLLLLPLSHHTLRAGDVEEFRQTKLCGSDEAYCADVVLQDGIKRLQTTGLVQISELLGTYPKGIGWFYIGTELDTTGVGGAGDIVTVTIPAGVDPDGSSCAAVDVDTTVTAGMVADDNPEIALASAIVTNLTGDSNFANCWKATRIKDHSGVFIESKFFNAFGTRTTWTASSTGTTVVTQANSDLAIRGLDTELQISPNDPRKGQLGIVGSIQLRPGGATDLFTEKAATTGSSTDMNVNGSVTPVVFYINAHATERKVIQYLTFSGTDAGIKYGQFLAINMRLTNGILVEFKSQDDTGSFESIDSTDDFEDAWSAVPSDFHLAVQAGGDHFNGTKDVSQSTIVLEPQGTFTTDDYIKITIRDDLTSVSEMNFRAKGFMELP